jgi:hypothetical protein
MYHAVLVSNMNKDFKYLEIPASLKPFIGEPDPDTRIYRREGSDEESGPWFDALGEHLPGEGFVSPGGVMMYAPVSRAAVHKRLKEGKMTAFCFHVVEAKRSIFGYQDKLKKRPYVYVPVSECKAWAEELKARPDRKEAYLEAAGGEKADGQPPLPNPPLHTFVEGREKKGVAAKKMPEMVELVRQALKEVLAEDFPTFMGAKARQGVARGRRSKSVVTR